MMLEDQIGSPDFSLLGFIGRERIAQKIPRSSATDADISVQGVISIPLDILHILRSAADIHSLP